MRTNVLAHGNHEASFGVHDLVAQVVPGLDERIHGRITACGSACHRLGNLSHERVQVAQGIEDCPDAEQLQSTDRLVVFVDRGAQCVLVGWAAAGEAIEAGKQDDRSVVRSASLFALLMVVLPAQAFALSAQTAAVEPQRCQARSRHAGDADRAGDDASQDSVAGHLSTDAERTRRLALAQGDVSVARWRAAGHQALEPRRRTSSRTVSRECVDGGPLSEVTPHDASSDAR